MDLIKEIKKVIEHHTYNLTDENGNKWEMLELSDITTLLNEAENQAFDLGAVVGRSEQLPTDIEIGKSVSDLANIADNEMER